MVREIPGGLPANVKAESRNCLCAALHAKISGTVRFMKDALGGCTSGGFCFVGAVVKHSVQRISTDAENFSSSRLVALDTLDNLSHVAFFHLL